MTDGTNESGIYTNTAYTLLCICVRRSVRFLPSRHRHQLPHAQDIYDVHTHTRVYIYMKFFVCVRVCTKRTRLYAYTHARTCTHAYKDVRTQIQDDETSVCVLALALQGWPGRRVRGITSVYTYTQCVCVCVCGAKVISGFHRRAPPWGTYVYIYYR